MKNMTPLPSPLSFVRSFILFFMFLAVKSSAQAVPDIQLTPVITTGLSAPIQLVNAGDGSNRLFIVQKEGDILCYDASYTYLSKFLSVSNIRTDGERGLLSMAFHPDYENNGFFYVYYVNTNGDLELARYHVSSNANLADASTKVILITIPHPNNTNHNGGQLNFGNDGYLYLSTGDGGGQGDAANNAQNTGVLLGKILRFNVTTSNVSPYYTIPSSNPYNNEIYDLGLRNPFRWSFDRQTQDMWIGDVGQDSWEEINFRPASAGPGQNFGWRCYEGNTAYNTAGCGPASSYVAPAYVYPTQEPAASVTGGIVYRGQAYPLLQGWYLSADFDSGIFYKIISDGAGGWTTHTQTLSPNGVVNFGEAENGEAYVVCHLNGTVHRISADNPVGISQTKTTNTPVAPKIVEGTLAVNLGEEPNYQLLEIMSMNGTVMIKERVAGKTGLQTTNVQGLSKGMYVLRLSGNTTAYVHKLIIE